jgi:hypothetical protein
MIITDKLFEAFLKCQTKAHLLSCAVAGAAHASHPINDWRQCLEEKFTLGCKEMLTAADPRACFIGTPMAHDFTHGHYALIIDPILIFDGTEARIDALQLVQPDKRCAAIVTCQSGSLHLRRLLNITGFNWRLTPLFWRKFPAEPQFPERSFMRDKKGHQVERTDRGGGISPREDARDPRRWHAPIARIRQCDIAFERRRAGAGRC